MTSFLPIEPTETHATVRKRTIRTGERLELLAAEEERSASLRAKDRCQLELELPGDRVGSSPSASIPRTFAARIQNRRTISNLLWQGAVVEFGARPAAGTSSPPALINMLCAIERFTRSGKRDIAALAISP